MNQGSADRVELVRAACRKYRDKPSLTVSKLIYNKHGHLFPSLEAVRSAVRFARGNIGNTHRSKGNKELHRENGVAGFQWQMPPSKSDPWEPFVLDSERVAVLSDIHIPFHDITALEVAIRKAKEYSPDCVLLNGDVCDFYSASRFDKLPSKSKLVDEIGHTRAFLGWLRNEFPKSRIVYKFGNHDEWFDKYVCRGAPELFGVPEIRLEHLLTAKREGEPEIAGVEFVRDQRIISIGKLCVLHGHELGKGSIAPPVNPARGSFMRAIECVLSGHLHKTSHHSETTMLGRLIACWSTGCLCGLHPEYARVNKWDHSFALVEQSAGGNFSVLPVRILNGKIL